MLQLSGAQTRIPGAAQCKMPVHFDERNCGDECASRPQDPPALRQQPIQVGDMFHHAVGENRGENAIRKYEPARIHA